MKLTETDRDIFESYEKEARRRAIKTVKDTLILILTAAVFWASLVLYQYFNP